MSLVKFSSKIPWMNSELSNFLNADDLFNDSFWNRTMMQQPAMNIKEADGEFEIELAAPGLKKEDFHVTVEDGHLIVSAEKEEIKEEKKKKYTRKEFSYNSFKRSLLLPENVKEDSIKATYKDGMLRLVLAKTETAKKQIPKEIEIS